MPSLAAPATDEMGRDNRAPGAIFEARRGRVPRGHRAVQAFYGEVIAISSQNVEIVRDLMEQFMQGDVAWDALDPQIEVYDHDILDAGEYRGHAGVIRWIEDWQEGLPITSIDLQECIDAGGAVVAVFLLRARARGSDVDVKRQDAIVFRLRDGSIVRFDYYNSRRQALHAVGLEE